MVETLHMLDSLRIGCGISAKSISRPSYVTPVEERPIPFGDDWWRRLLFGRRNAPNGV